MVKAFSKIAVAVLLTISLSACGDASNSTSNSSTSSSSSTKVDNNGQDSRIKIGLNGTATDALSYNGGGMTGYFWLIQTTVQNITKNPITLNGVNYVIDSDGNSYAAAIGSGACAVAVTDWTLTLNPKEAGSNLSCFDLPDGITIKEFKVTDKDSGNTMYSVPLDQALDSKNHG